MQQDLSCGAQPQQQLKQILERALNCRFQARHRRLLHLPLHQLCLLQLPLHSKHQTRAAVLLAPSLTSWKELPCDWRNEAWRALPGTTGVSA